LRDVGWGLTVLLFFFLVAHGFLFDSGSPRGEPPVADVEWHDFFLSPEWDPIGLPPPHHPFPEPCPPLEFAFFFFFVHWHFFGSLFHFSFLPHIFNTGRCPIQVLTTGI